jgi:hypothetical protein
MEGRNKLRFSVLSQHYWLKLGTEDGMPKMEHMMEHLAIDYKPN